MAQPGNTEPESDADAALVAACKRGDLDAFDALVHKHQKRMFNVAYRITGDYEDAAETAQDAFVAAYRNIGSFRGSAKFSTWLTAITVNHARNRLKREKTRRSREPRSLDDPIDGKENGRTMDPPSPDPGALEGLERREVSTGVQDCIAALDAEFREVIVLRDIQGFSYDEIGGMLKLREGTVKSRLFRARDAVKECLKKVLGPL